MRVGSLHVGQTSITLDAETGAERSMRPPGAIWVPPMRLASRIGRGFWCFVCMLRFSTITFPSRGRASRIRPCLPRSLPVSIWTVSPFFSLIAVVISLKHLWSQAHDLHEVLLAQLAGNRPEDARSTWIALCVDDHRRVLVERDQCSVVAPERLLRPHDDGLHHLTLLDRSLRGSGLDGGGDDVPDTRVAALRAARDADAE